MSEISARNPETPGGQATLCGRVLSLGRKHISLEIEGQLRFDVPYRLSRRARNLAGADSVLFQWETTSGARQASVLIHGPGPSRNAL